MDAAFIRVGVVELKSAKLIATNTQVVSFAEAGQIDAVDPVGLENVVEFVKATERVVALDRDIPAGAPPRGQ